ncbi:hypothetical protein [Photobacterium damselae]|uniref:hypothetical protein n=1 Tax=Photobacterium damselae TaxID=38293 RepID=UPI000D06BAEC|nr:hypothetical protein [Photobacterium damselae]PSB80822.1 hypothetical protein C5F62_13865 [Photobacterium damselae subsp. damselae]
MIDLSSPLDSTVLLKESQGYKTYLVNARYDGKLELKDMGNDTTFIFSYDQLEAFINDGMFTIRNREEVLKHIKQLVPVPSDNPTVQKVKTEQKRRLLYVNGVLEADLPTGTPHKLTPYIHIKALELNDKQPPSASSLYRWLKAYKESNYDEASLLPRYDKAGNRNAKIPKEHNVLIDEILDEWELKEKITALYAKYLNRLDGINQKHIGIDLAPFKPISLQSFRERCRKANLN